MALYHRIQAQGPSDQCGMGMVHLQYQHDSQYWYHWQDNVRDCNTTHLTQPKAHFV